MDNTLKSAHKILSMYKNLTYFDQYGGSVFIFIVLVIILFCVYSYSQVMVNIQPIKDNWVAERCSPRVIPFAGLINKPDDMSVGAFTEQNFSYCLQNILVSISGFAIQPLTFVTESLNTMFTDLMVAVNAIRNIMTNIRIDIAQVASEIMGRLMNIMIPLQVIIIGMVDFFGKVKGIITAALFTSLGTYYTLQSFINSIANIIILILIIVAVILAGMWAMTAIPIIGAAFVPPAVALTAIFILYATVTTIIVLFMEDALNIYPDQPIPAVPGSCFHPDTHLKLIGGEITKIKDLHLGDVLENGSRVVALMKIDNSLNCESFYKLPKQGVNSEDIYVTGEHYIEDPNITNKFIKVKSHPLVMKQSNVKSSIFSCIITDDHKIQIGSQLFWDWEDYLLR